MLSRHSSRDPVGTSSSTQPTRVDVLPRQATKHRACNECRQQKLRCDLVNAEDIESTICSRCQKLSLDCRIDETFQRTRKRRRSRDLEQEIEQLKQRLYVFTSNTPALWDESAPIDIPTLADERYQTGSNSRDVHPSRTALGMSTTVPGGISPEIPDRSTVPGMTTLPQDTSPRPRGPTVTSSREILGNIELSPQDISQLFDIYFSNYHPFLPFLDPTITAQQYLDASRPLFWMIMSVAARRLSTNPTLLTRLARSVPELIWSTTQVLPHSLGLIQCLVLLCTWPFPTSSTTTDPSYMYVGMMIQSAMQMGLHRPASPEDFTKYRLNLSAKQVAERRRTWVACNIVAHLVSMGVGLPAPSQLRDPSLMPSINLETPQDSDLDLIFRCTEQLHSCELSSSFDRPALYAIRDHELSKIQLTMDTASNYAAFYLLSTRLNLQAFFLFDDTATVGYSEHIGMLYSTACGLVQHVQPGDEENSSSRLLSFLPHFCYQSFLCAAFVLLKILKNNYFASILDATIGTKLLNSAVTSLRRISVANNDLPGRLSDVLAYLWTHPEPAVISGSDIRGLQLNVKSRMSMSIVYDSLWRWREQFQREESMGNGTKQANDLGMDSVTIFGQPFDSGDQLDLLNNLLDVDWLS